MSDLITLVRHSLHRRRGLLAAMCLILFLFQIVMIVAARAVQNSGGFSMLGGLMPSFLEEWTNMAALSFRGMVLFGYTHPVVLLFFIAIAIVIGSEPAAEIDSKFIDLLMARPIARSVVINRSILVLLTATLAGIASMIAGTMGGLALLAPASTPGPELRVILSLAVNLALIVLAWGAVTLAIASFANRGGGASAIGGLLAFVMIVIDYVGRFWETARPISRISPFHYFNPFQIIGGQPLRVMDMLVLIAVFLAGWVIAIVSYARRDLV
ncbi:MAG TPA: hypothetical protein VGK04_05235 [Thermoanaerobaculia bacterium]